MILSIRNLCIFCLVSNSLPVSTLAQGTVLTDTIGHKAIARLVKDENKQLDLEISPHQLKLLAGLLESQEVISAPQGRSEELGFDIGGFQDLRKGEFFGAETQGKPIARKDLVVARKLPGILEPAQLDGLRIPHIRKQVRFPLGAFSDTCLMNLSLSEEEIRAFDEPLAKAHKVVAGHLVALRKQAVAELLSSFSVESRMQFIKCFGEFYVPKEYRKASFSEDSSGVVGADQGLLLLASFRQFGKDEEFLKRASVETVPTIEQFREIKKLVAKVAGTRPGIRNRIVSEELPLILSPDQIRDLLLKNHLWRLEESLQNATSRKTTTYFGLTDKESVAFSKSAVKLQEKIDRRRIELEFKLLKELIELVPADLRPLFVLVFDRVWGDIDI